MYNVLSLTCFKYLCVEIYILPIILLHLPFVIVYSAQKALQERYIPVKDHPRTTFLLTFLDKAATIYFFQTFIPKYYYLSCAWGDPTKDYVVFLVKGLVSNWSYYPFVKTLFGWMDEIAVGRSRVSEEASIGWRGSFPCVSFQKDLNPVVLCTLLFSRVQGHKKSWIQMMISIHSLEKFITSPWIWYLSPSIGVAKQSPSIRDGVKRFALHSEISIHTITILSSPPSKPSS